jgi:hypothetical protein
MPTYVPWGFLEQTSPPPHTVHLGRGGAESTVKMSEPEQPPFTVLPGAGLSVSYVVFNYYVW